MNIHNLMMSAYTYYYQVIVLLILDQVALRTHSSSSPTLAMGFQTTKVSCHPLARFYAAPHSSRGSKRTRPFPVH